MNEVYNNSNELQQFNDFIITKKKKQFEKARKIFLCIACSLCVITVLLSTVGFLFVGMGNVFDVRFSIPQIADWFLHLNTKPIANPTSQLFEFILIYLFLFLFIIIGIIMIVSTIKTISRVFVTLDFLQKNFDRRQQFGKVVSSAINVFSCCFYVTCLFFTTNFNQVYPIFWIVVCSFFILLVVLAFEKTFSKFFDEKTSLIDHKSLIIHIVKTISLCLAGVFLMILCFAPFLGAFSESLSFYVRNKQPYHFSIFYNLGKIILFLVTVRLFLYLIRYGSLDFFFQPVVLSNEKYSFNDSLNEYNSKIKGTTKWLIVLCVLFTISDVAIFIFPNNLANVSYISLIYLATTYIPCIFCAVAIRFLCKISDKKISRLS